MTTTSVNKNGWRTQPMYSFNEVAHLSGISVSTVRNWLFGYTVDERQVSPLLKASSDTTVCSFLNLIEIMVAAKFRKAEGTSYEVVKRTYENARKLYSIEHPFASDLRLKAIGGHIVHMIKEKGSLQAIDSPEQFTLPYLVIETIEQLEFELELASKWYPVGKKIPIVVDPYVSAGVPIIEGRGITVENIEKRFYLGKQTWEFIAKDLELQQSVVQEVIRFAPRVFHRKETVLASTL
ncbi:DUF433 domain-containing protein [Chloroflexota bacterium]